MGTWSGPRSLSRLESYVRYPPGRALSLSVSLANGAGQNRSGLHGETQPVPGPNGRVSASDGGSQSLQLNSCAVSLPLGINQDQV